MKLNISSLFWKIFLSFWLANILVLFSATYFTLLSNENREHENRRQEIATHLGDLLISALQKGDKIPRFLKKRSNKDLKKEVRITDEEGLVLFDNFEDKNHIHKKSPIFERYPYTAEDGKPYFITIPANRYNLILMKRIHKMLVFRLLLILFFSGLISYFLSRFITQPLLSLGLNSRAFAQQDDVDQQAMQKLLNRPDEIGVLARDIDRMQQSLTQLINDKQNLLHDVSHELRAPLARLMTATALLETKCTGETQLLQRLHIECENMAGLIDSILHLSRLSEKPINNESFELTALLKQCEQNCQFEFPEIPIALKQTSSLIINTDVALLTMVLMNILRNACLHSGTKEAITLEADRKGQSIFIHIKDKGKGLSPEQLQQIFTPFHRDENSSGFGLGMSISKRAVEKLSGTLQVENRASGGLWVKIQIEDRQV